MSLESLFCCFHYIHLLIFAVFTLIFFVLGVVSLFWSIGARFIYTFIWLD